MNTQQDSRLLETLTQLNGNVIVSDSDTVHLSMECHHVDRHKLGGPTSFECQFRNMDVDDLIASLNNKYPTTLSLCSNCDNNWGIEEKQV